MSGGYTKRVVDVRLDTWAEFRSWVYAAHVTCVKGAIRGELDEALKNHVQVLKAKAESLRRKTEIGIR